MDDVKIWSEPAIPSPLGGQLRFISLTLRIFRRVRKGGGLRTIPHLWIHHHVHGSLCIHHVFNVMDHLLKYRSVSYHRNPNWNDHGSDHDFLGFSPYYLERFFKLWVDSLLKF
jgi:hypothetical protein